MLQGRFVTTGPWGKSQTVVCVCVCVCVCVWKRGRDRKITNLVTTFNNSNSETNKCYQNHLMGWPYALRKLGSNGYLEKGMATHSVFLPGKFHGQRSLAGYSPWGGKELATTEQLTLVLMANCGSSDLGNKNKNKFTLIIHFSLKCII